MKRPIVLAHNFVRSIPDKLEEHTLYVSIEYATVVHKCCCGCGHEVVTPLSPTDWSVTYDGESISLYPSIGNWSFECRSHYWIEKSTVTWAGQISKKQIESGRLRDRHAKKRYYADVDGPRHADENSRRRRARKGFWSWLSSIWSNLAK